MQNLQRRREVGINFHDITNSNNFALDYRYRAKNVREKKKERRRRVPARTTKKTRGKEMTNRKKVKDKRIKRAKRKMVP